MEPKAGTMEWLRCWHDSRFSRGALVQVGDRRGWVTSAKGGRVVVAPMDGPSRRERLTVLPGDVTFL